MSSNNNTKYQFYIKTFLKVQVCNLWYIASNMHLEVVNDKGIWYILRSLNILKNINGMCNMLQTLENIIAKDLEACISLTM